LLTRVCEQLEVLGVQDMCPYVIKGCNLVLIHLGYMERYRLARQE